LRFFQGRNLVLINKSATPYDERAQLVIHEAIGRVMDKAWQQLNSANIPGEQL